MSVFVVTEHEPDQTDFPVVVKAVFSSRVLAETFIASQEQRHWTEEEINAEESAEVWWEVEEWGINGKTSEIDCYCNPESAGKPPHHPEYPHPLCPLCPTGHILPALEEAPCRAH